LGTMSQTLELCSSSLSSFIHKSTKKKKWELKTFLYNQKH
jgi:hypothetical protein